MDEPNLEKLLNEYAEPTLAKSKTERDDPIFAMP